MAKNTPHPCSSVAQQNQLPGEFHPSPPSPLPFQGRGVPCALSSARRNTQSSPRPRNGGEGSGVREKAPPGTRRGSPLTSPPAAAVQIHGHLCRLCALCGSKNTLHARLLRGRTRAGKPELRGGLQQGVVPLTPVPSPLPGARGAGVIYSAKTQNPTLAPARARGASFSRERGRYHLRRTAVCGVHRVRDESLRGRKSDAVCGA